MSRSPWSQGKSRRSPLHLLQGNSNSSASKSPWAGDSGAAMRALLLDKVHTWTHTSCTEQATFSSCNTMLLACQFHSQWCSAPMQVASDDGRIRVTRLQKTSRARMKSTTGHTEKRPVPQMQRASDAYLQTPVGMFPSNIFSQLIRPSSCLTLCRCPRRTYRRTHSSRPGKAAQNWRHCRESNSGCWIQSPK